MFLKKKISVAALSVIIAFSLTASSTAKALEKKPENNAYVDTKMVTLGGDAFGIKLYTEGVVIVEVADVVIEGKSYSPAQKANLQVNDVILKINGLKITSNEELGEIIKRSGDSPIMLTVKRENKVFETKLTPIKDTEGQLRAGIWIRDSSAGIGTVTFYDTENGYLASLGHGICDANTGLLLPLNRGEAVKADVTGINKGTKGTAGGLNGYFGNDIIGSIVENSDYGVFVSLNSEQINSGEINGQKIKLAEANEVHAGKAYIISTINQDGPRRFEAEIEYADKDYQGKTKNFIIKITDRILLDQTGGIVQGMSGSPVIQNEKLVGAVTHVFLNEPDKGFGIYAVNMVDNYRKLSYNRQENAA